MASTQGLSKRRTLFRCHVQAAFAAPPEYVIRRRGPLLGAEPMNFTLGEVAAKIFAQIASAMHAVQ